MGSKFKGFRVHCPLSGPPSLPPPLLHRLSGGQPPRLTASQIYRGELERLTNLWDLSHLHCLPACLPTPPPYHPASLHPCLLTYLPFSLSSYILASLPPCHPTSLPSCLLAFLPVSLPDCLLPLVYLLPYLPFLSACMPPYLPAFSPYHLPPCLSLYPSLLVPSLSLCLSSYLSICLRLLSPLCLFNSLSTCFPVSTTLSPYLPISLSVRLTSPFACNPVCLPPYLHVSLISLPIYLPIYASTSLFAYIVCLSPYLSISLSVRLPPCSPVFLLAFLPPYLSPFAYLPVCLLVCFPPDLHVLLPPQPPYAPPCLPPSPSPYTRTGNNSKVR